jgi:hypothetical protein
MSDYLWDKSGEPDADVERLEEMLGRFRHAGRAPELPSEFESHASTPEVETRAPTRARVFGASGLLRPARLAVAAALLLAVLAGAFAMMRAFKKDGGRATVNNETQVARPRPDSREEPKAPEESRAPEVAASPSNQSAPHEGLRREPLRRDELTGAQPFTNPRRREPAPREAASNARMGREIKTAAASVGVDGGGAADLQRRVRAKEQLVYALRLTSEALKEVRGRASGLDARANAFDGRSPLK